MNSNFGTNNQSVFDIPYSNIKFMNNFETKIPFDNHKANNNLVGFIPNVIQVTAGVNRSFIIMMSLNHLNVGHGSNWSVLNIYSQTVTSSGMCNT